MEAYQVFKGDTDKHGRQIYDLVATYLDKEKALQHCKKIGGGGAMIQYHFDNCKYKNK